MTKIQSRISPRSPQFEENQKANLEAMRVVEDAARSAMLGGSEKSRERHISRGKMLPRERVANLLDPGSPFLEIGTTASHGMYDNASPCASLIAGIGRVEGQEVMVICNDADRQGWYVLSNVGEEAFACTGNCRAKPSAVRDFG